MKVFVAGATGAVGARLVPLLVAHGHEVTAMTRSAGKADGLRAAAAIPVVADGLDAAAVHDAVRRARPEVVVHEMTGLAGVKSLRRFDDEFALTNRLRTEGTDNLLDAARAAAEVNGQPGALVLDSRGELINVFVLEIADGAIQTIRSVINPDKLGHLGYEVSELARWERKDPAS